MHTLQALLLVGGCDKVAGQPGAFVAAAVPPAWAQSVLHSTAMLSLHNRVGEVAHELLRVVTVAEAVHKPFLSKLF